MTKSEIARDKMRLWGYISRAKRVGKKIPEHWLIYGDGPKSTSEALETAFDSLVDKWSKLFERDDFFYQQIKRK